MTPPEVLQDTGRSGVSVLLLIHTGLEPLTASVASDSDSTLENKYLLGFKAGR
jgi:hypothetical protein